MHDAAALLGVRGWLTGLRPALAATRAAEAAYGAAQVDKKTANAALTAAEIRPGDRVLEPSAGTGLLAILAQLAGGSLTLNELAETRAGLLAMLFPETTVTRFDAVQIDDHLDATVVPSVVLMNPPFSAMAHVSGRVQDAGFRHISSALRRLAPGGRLVTITGANVGPDTSDWREAFVSLQARARVVFSCPIAGALYARHGVPEVWIVDLRGRTVDVCRQPGQGGYAEQRSEVTGELTPMLVPTLRIDVSALIGA